jgi:hypothetical protein
MANRGMSSRRRMLVALNVGLVVVLAGVAVAPSALAQRAAARQRGDYTMVSGQILGSVEHGLYIVDAANQEMVCLQFDRSRQGMRFVGYRDLAADVRAASTRSR